MKEIYDAIPTRCFKSSTLRSMAYAVRDILYICVLIYLAATLIPYIPNLYCRFAAWALYTILQSLVFTGVWILAHECGHGAFSNSKMLNWTMGLIMHSFLLVPFHSWRLTHSQHHKATGHIEKDTAFVPYDQESWVRANLGVQTDRIDLSELIEDSPISAVYHDFLHQLCGWPGYLLFHWSGQQYEAKDIKVSHFYFGKDSVLYKARDLPLILLSDFGVAAMMVCLAAAGYICGSWNIIVHWCIPWLWTNSWIVAITFLHHTDGSLPHYDRTAWTFARGAAATIDRDFGFIDRHFFHNIIGTHVCHHLISTIPFYHAVEASIHVKKIMGVHYKEDTKTGFWTAFWRNRRSCHFVEESKGKEGSGVYMFRNALTKGGQSAVSRTK